MLTVPPLTADPSVLEARNAMAKENEAATSGKSESGAGGTRSGSSRPSNPMKASSGNSARGPAVSRTSKGDSPHKKGAPPPELKPPPKVRPACKHTHRAWTRMHCTHTYACMRTHIREHSFMHAPAPTRKRAPACAGLHERGVFTKEEGGRGRGRGRAGG